MNTVMHPTIIEIRGSLPAERSNAEKSLWYVRYVLRPSAVYLAWVLIRLRVSCKQVVLIGLVIGLGGCVSVAFGMYWVVVIGCLLLVIGSWMDYVDGTIARATNTVDKEGAYLDLVKDNIIGVSVPIAVGIGASMPMWGLTLALMYAYSTLSVMDGRYVFGDKENIYQADGRGLWQWAFLFGTNIQVLYLPLLLVAALTHNLPIYLYVFIALNGCEIIAIVAKRIKVARGDK